MIRLLDIFKQVESRGRDRKIAPVTTRSPLSCRKSGGIATWNWTWPTRWRPLQHRRIYHYNTDNFMCCRRTELEYENIVLSSCRSCMEYEESVEGRMRFIPERKTVAAF